MSEHSPVTRTSTVPMLDLTAQVEALWPELTAATERVMRSGQFIGGPEVEGFEEEAARYLGTRHAVGLNSGTDALVIALRALGVGPGDEVITSSFSFFATAESISVVGATPVFVDIDEATFDLDPRLLERAITDRTKAIMPVHLYGRPVDMGPLLALARAEDLLVIEDCAQSFGATWQGRQTGTLGDVGAFSFFPTKNLGAYGDGGLLATSSDEVARAARMLRNHGSLERYRNEVLGYNSRLDAMQAAILRVKLPRVDAWNRKRREVATYYGELLAGVPGVIAPEVSPGHVFHQYTVRLPGVNRDRVRAVMNEDGVQSMVYYPVPQHLLPVYAGRYPSLPVTERLAGEVLSLPIWPEMGREVQERVVEALAVALAT